MENADDQISMEKKGMRTGMDAVVLIVRKCLRVETNKNNPISIILFLFSKISLMPLFHSFLKKKIKTPHKEQKPPGLMCHN